MTTDYKFEGWMGEDEKSAEGNMVWQEYEPKKWEETDIDIRITHCGICGSDLHVLRSGWRQAPYPVVVGHEIVGVAVRVGSQAEGGIKVGDIVGVGAQSDACLNRKLGDDNNERPKCNECASGEENYCTRMAPTYGSKFLSTGDKTQGGYARYHRCPSHFVFRIPEGVAPEYAAPLLCGGVTVYSPLKQFGAGPGKKVGIVGVGGLGHFAVLFARALGADEVVGISRRESKRQQAMDLGCTDYIATADEEGWETKNSRRLDLIISTVSSPKMPLADYIGLLRLDGTLVQVGLPEGQLPFRPGSLTGARRRIAGSNIGSPAEIKEMLQLVADKNVKPWVEMRPMSEANQAIIDFEAGKPRFRYVLVNPDS
ncbi:NADP-dependent alcohol dehydrogenase 6 [Fusarium mundagurra]|uniref:alcohol dehydrogenase (NADP(+)) n=1 Tax=Fusarium mundagurra TaxID=1567541 RepID=A0A8H5YHQ4_9HYPO|nr:NADP-dependent alcohol dehydrogenase 6 [Fusarium mundagurra]